jgi:hypothetical protein
MWISFYEFDFDDRLSFSQTPLLDFERGRIGDGQVFDCQRRIGVTFAVRIRKFSGMRAGRAREQERQEKERDGRQDLGQHLGGPFIC